MSCVLVSWYHFCHRIGADVDHSAGGMRLVVWTFRICVGMTVALMLTSSVFLTRAILGLADGEAVVVGLILTAAAMLTGGAAGWQYSTLYARSLGEADGTSGDAEATDGLGGRPSWNTKALLISGSVAVIAMTASVVYALLREGNVSTMQGTGFVISWLLFGVAILLWRHSK